MPTGFVQRIRGKVALDSLFLAAKEVPTLITFAIAQNATQYATEVKIQCANKDGIAITGIHQLVIWLSDDAAGLGVTATDPFGAVAAKAASGTILGTLTAKKSFAVTTLADGSFTLQIIDDATPVFLYVAAAVPATGLACVSRKTVAGDYKP
jgi:hypothetical protein